MKGNNYRIEGNTGTNPLLDGFQTHSLVAGAGDDNVFAGNTVDLGGSDGYAIRLACKGKRGTATGNVVEDDNEATGGAGVSNSC